jgi:hypothetical protein
MVGSHGPGVRTDRLLAAVTIAIRSQDLSPPRSGDDFARTVAKAQADVRAAAERAGLRQDPYGQVIDALSVTLGLFPQLVQQLEGAVERGRQPLDDATLDRLLRAAVSGADRRAAALARARISRTAVLASVVLILVGGAGLAGGYWWGRAEEASTYRVTAARLAAAFRDGPEIAARWLDLMRWNSLPEALKACDQGQAFTDQQSGRRACSLPLWLEPPKVRAPG